MKNFKLFITIFIFITIAEIFFMFIGILAYSFFEWKLPDLPILNEYSMKNIRGLIIVNLLCSIPYFVLYKLMKVK